MAQKVVYTAYAGAALTEIYIIYSYSQDIANNTTTVTAEARWRKLHSGAYGYRNQGVNFRLRLDGTDKNHSWTFNLGNVGVGATGSITSTSKTILHNPDGTLGNIGISVYCATGTTSFGTINGSMSFGVPTIPRASSYSISGTADLGVSRTFTISSASSSFNHSISWYAGQIGGTVYATGSSRTPKWIPPVATFASLIPNSTSISIGTNLYTYSGSTEIGKVSQRFTANLPENVKPTINSISVSGDRLLVGKYVQGKSRVKVTINDSGVYGSEITNRWTSVQGGGIHSQQTFTSEILSISGPIWISSESTDSRGRRTGAKTASIKVEPYSNPVVNSLSVVRVNADGTTNSSGNYIRIKSTGKVSTVDGANPPRKLVVKYRQTGVGAWTTIPNTNAASYSPSFDKTVAASANHTYEVESFLEDYFASHTREANIGTGFVLMDFHKNGTSMAIGKAAEGKGLFEIGGDTYLNGVIKDLVEFEHYGEDEPSLGSRNNSSIIVGATPNYGLSIGGGGSGHNWMQSQRFDGRADTYGLKLNPLGGEVTINGWLAYHVGNSGGIISGSNSNGSYTKLPDGTMICYDTPTLTSSYSKSEKVINFAQQFVGTPIVNIQQLSVETSNISSSGVRVEISSPTKTPIGSATDGVNISYMAVGRWK